MKRYIYDIYTNEINNIIKRDEVLAISLVGSSKNIDLTKEDVDINDIDLFVLTKNGKKQIREIKIVNDIEFDVNYFSIEVTEKLINNKEYFFLKEMSNPKVIHDATGEFEEIIKRCKNNLEEGPNVATIDEKSFIKNELKSKINKLKDNKNIDEYEYKFLLNTYLREIIIGYFNINNMWIPKDKNLLKTIRIEHKELYRIVESTLDKQNYKELISVFEYVFKDVKLNENIKINIT